MADGTGTLSLATGSVLTLWATGSDLVLWAAGSALTLRAADSAVSTRHSGRFRLPSATRAQKRNASNRVFMQLSVKQNVQTMPL